MPLAQYETILSRFDRCTTGSDSRSSEPATELASEEATMEKAYQNIQDRKSPTHVAFLGLRHGVQNIESQLRRLSRQLCGFSQNGPLNRFSQE